MRYVTYKWVTDHDDEMSGLRPRNVCLPECIQPVKGLGLAHDLLEHQNGFEGMGTVEDELEALGASLFVRGSFRSTARDGGRCIFEAVAWNIEHMWAIRPGLRSCTYRGAKLGAECVNVALEIAKEKFVYIDEAFWQTAWHYMVRGYDKAVRRFGKHNQALVNEQFFNLIEAIDERIEGGVEEGDQFRLAWGLEYFQFYKVQGCNRW